MGGLLSLLGLRRIAAKFGDWSFSSYALGGQCGQSADRFQAKICRYKGTAGIRSHRVLGVRLRSIGFRV